MPKKKQTALQKAIIKAQKTPVEYVTFSGGGAKGVAYSGVYDALMRGGIIQNVKAVAGASAGAITAAVVATGITVEEFEKISKNTNLKGLLGKQGTMMINKDGTPLYELVKNTIQTNVSKYLNNNDILEVCTKRIDSIRLEQEKIREQLKPYTDYQNSITDKINKLEAESRNEKALDSQNFIEEQIDLLQKQEKEVQNNIKEFNWQDTDLQNQTKKLATIINNKGAELTELRDRANGGGKIYFKDLALLKSVNPDRFKDLVMTAVRRDNAELTIFSPHTTPDVEIALAARASASIPIVFQPVTINGVQYVDGGYRDNTPTSHFKKNKGQGAEDITDNPEKIQEAKKKDRTLALAFGTNKSDDPLHVALYSEKQKIFAPNLVVKFLMDVVFKMAAKIGGKFKYSESEQKKFEEIRSNALDTVTVGTGKVSTLSFDEAQKKADYLYLKGYVQTMGHMNNHELGTDIDKNIQHKDFMLTVFEKVDANVKSSWSSRVNAGREAKAEMLLEFCKPKKWQENSKEELLEKYIATAAINYKQGKLADNTSTMTKLIETLNNVKTPDSVKKDYAKVLGIDITNKKDIGKLKFKKEDFKAVLNRNKDTIKLDKGRIK